MHFSRFSCWVLKNTCGAQKYGSIRNFSCSSHQSLRFVQYKDGVNRGLGVQINNGASIVSLNGADETIPIDMVSFLHRKYPLEKVEKYVHSY